MPRRIQTNNDLHVFPRYGTLDELVQRVLADALSGIDPRDTYAKLRSDFGLSEEAATLAMDRVLGGVLRAARNPEHPPDAVKDPLALAAFRRASDDPAAFAPLVARWASKPDPHPPAKIHPVRCEFCGSTEFWDLSHGPVHSSGIELASGRRFSRWAFEFDVRCAKCQATFNTSSPTNKPDGESLQWHLGRAR
jgi:hypothetical protein